MLFRAPRNLPDFRDLIADVHAPIEATARHLGVTPATIARWMVRGAPRAAALALFWETDCGRATADFELLNWSNWQTGRARALERQNQALRAKLEKMARIVETLDTAANAPLYQA